MLTSEALFRRFVQCRAEGCPDAVGIYNWKLEEDKLIMAAVEDTWAIRLRAKNLSNLPWLSCRPPTTEAGITDHWPKPAGCQWGPANPSPGQAATRSVSVRRAGASNSISRNARRRCRMTLFLQVALAYDCRNASA